MSVELQAGDRLLKLRDSAPRGSAPPDDVATMVHLWRLLTGGGALRDTTLGARRFL